MEINALPKYDMSDNPASCSQEFDSEARNEQPLHFKDNLIIKAKTRSISHIPANMNSIFPKIPLVRKTYFYYTACPEYAKFYA